LFKEETEEQQITTPCSRSLNAPADGCVGVRRVKMAKKGKLFEDLVYTISKCLHERAEVVLDDRLPDKDTGRKRQIDISVCLKDGPAEFLAIIEARDRSRPVGVEYIEQVESKRKSVCADKAVVVSNKGFYKNALEKARSYRIYTLTLKEARENDWSFTLRQLSHFSIHSIGSNLTIYFLDKNNKIINPHASIKQGIREKGLDYGLIERDTGEIVATGRRLINLAYERFKISELVDTDPFKKHNIKLIVDVRSEEPLYFKDESGTKRKFERYGIIGEVWREITKHDTKISQYKDEKTGEVYAEVVGFKKPHELGFDLILENPNADRDRKMFIRLRPLAKRSGGRS
jgi:hypothetical protein